METHKRQEDKSPFNRVWVGFLLALALPFLVMSLYWYALLSQTASFGVLFTNAAIFMKVISICASPDILMFIFFNRKNWTEGSKGIVLAILLMLLVTIFIKL